MLRLAKAQHGVVSRQQLVIAGISGTLIDQRVRDSKLIPVFTGVYGLGHDVISHRGWWWAALLSGGPGTVLSHTSAAACWGLIAPRNRTEILRRYNRDRLTGSPPRLNAKLLTVHRSRCLPPGDLTVHDGFPVTTVARTILNLSARSSPAEVESLVSEADRLEILDWKQLEEASERGPGWKGTRELKRILEAWDPRNGETKSRLERRFLSFCHLHSVPAPLVNVWLEGFQVDCFWPGKRLVIELDSRGFHADLKTFDSDRSRDVILKNAGYDVRRVTHRHLVEQPGFVLSEVLSPLRNA